MIHLKKIVLCLILPLLFGSLFYCSRSSDESKSEENEQLVNSTSPSLKEGLYFDSIMLIVQRVSSFSDAGVADGEKHFAYPARYSVKSVKSNGDNIMSRTPLGFVYAVVDYNNFDQNFSFDWRVDPNTKLPSHLWSQLAEIDLSIEVLLSNNNSTVNVLNLSGILDAIIKKAELIFGKAAVSEDSVFAKQLKDYYGDKKTVEERIGSYFESCSLYNINVGETRKIKSAVQSGLFYIESEYSCLAEEDDLLRIKYRSEYVMINKSEDSSKKDATLDNDNLSTFYKNIEGGAEGTLYIMKSSGWIYKGNIDSYSSFETGDHTKKDITLTTIYQQNIQYMPYNPSLDIIELLKQQSQHMRSQ